ncbi:MAG TPA: M42 family metallopeptidase [Clostridiaceae bacterium]|nr:M42 family metallopeptidase [Clostridiaceae bacterium]
MEIKSILKELTKENGASGYEHNVSQILANHLRKYCDDVQVDKLGSVIGRKKGSNPSRKILITAHYDEIGLLVTSIDKEGFIRFTKIGGIDPKILLATEVVIHGKNSIPGVIGAKPPHLLSPEDRNKTMGLQDLYIDTGMNYEEITQYVSIGDYITFKPVSLELKSNYFSSKALDNRCSFASMLVALEELKNLKHECDIYFAATVQEEIGLTGGITVSYNIDPDMAIVVDVCHGDMPDVPKEVTFPCGKGPAIAVGPVLNKKFTNKLIDKAKYENIKYQIDVEPGGTGTEAWATQVSRCGIPTVLISIPLRYMHTAVETLNITDLTETGKLIARFAASLTDEDFEKKEEIPAWICKF